ncbi:DUF2860 family protein [Dongshaea marina]|uniref:DUF2860 family protein n=1 Tax=Dongshaea marina TaxID=2047966 RepID=UPI00131F3834|nr:DUF2860 family protein [Dongshaea marina]
MKIPKESGFSGYLMGGANYSQFSSNFVAGTSLGDSANAQSDGINNEPSRKSGTNPTFNFDLRYTFGQSQTQIFVGNLIQNALQLDFSQQLGVRHQLDGKGIVQAAYIFSGITNQVWSDPYKTNGDRDKTDVKKNGAKLGWDRIMGTPWGASVSFVKKELDDEQSGVSQQSAYGLTSTDLKMLDRNGNITSLEGSYNFRLARGQLLTPSLQYSHYDLDGSAMSGNSYGMQLTHTLMLRKYSLVTNLYAGRTLYDEANPIYDMKANSNEYLFNTNLIRRQLFGFQQLNGMITASWGKSISDISYYNTEIRSVTVGVMYLF